MIDLASLLSTAEARDALAKPRLAALGVETPRDFVRVLRDSASAASTRAGKTRAAAFGETGLFRPPVAWKNDPEAPPQVDPEAGPREPAETQVSAATGQEQFAALPAGHPSSRGLQGSIELATPAPTAASTSVASRTALPLATATIRAAPHGKDAGAAIRPRPATSLVRQLAGASLDLRVAAEAVGRGISVRVAIAGLHPDERRDLAERIAELLARHGYAGAAISLNGAPALVSDLRPNLQRERDTWR